MKNKKILVYAVPVTTRRRVVDTYYEIARKTSSTEWVFVLGVLDYPTTENISIIRYPWIAKSWFHREFFDQFFLPLIVKRIDPDEIYCLQNIAVFCSDKPQMVYVHQPIPFTQYKFHFFDSPKYWIYQNVVSRIMFRSIKKATHVIVQTNSMRDAVIRKTGIQSEKIEVIPLDTCFEPKVKYKEDNSSQTIFFYPSAGYLYKNHKAIIEAVKLLKKEGICEYSVLLTAESDENKMLKSLSEECKALNLPVKFLGNISQDELLEYYSKSTLVFPSYVETYGLPLFEASSCGCPILASDCDFSHEVLRNYKKVKFFDPFNYYELAELMKISIQGNF